LQPHESDIDGSTSRNPLKKNRDFVILGVVALLLICGFVALTFKLIDQEDEHVRVVEKVRISEGFSDDVMGKDEAQQTVSLMLRDHPGETDVDFSTITLTDNEMPMVAKFQHMKKLKLSHTKITDKGLAYLKNCGTKELDISGTLVSDKGMDTVATMKNLQELTLTDCNITDKGIEQIKDLPRINIVVMSGTKITDKAIKALENSLSMRRIYMGSCKVTAESLKSISKMQLFGLYMDHTSINGFGIKKNLRAPTIKKLSVDACPLGDGDVAAIVEAVPNVMVLDIGNTAVSDAGLLGLAKLRFLKTVKVRFCKRISEEGINAFTSLRPDCEVDAEIM